MADVSISATAVKLVGVGQASQVQFGETVTHGQLVYFDTATNRYKLANVSGAVTGAEKPYGLALTPGANGDYGYVARSNVVVQLNTTGVLVQGRVYVLGSAAGAIAPEADLASISYVAVVGVAVNTTQLHLNFFTPGYLTS